MQNYREATRPHSDASASRSDLRQVLLVAFAAVLVAIALAGVELLGARLDPDGADCIMTDNAGCVADPTPDGARSDLGNAVGNAVVPAAGEAG